MSNNEETIIYTPVYIDQSIENVKKLKEIMARDKGFTSLKDCILSAVDFFVTHYPGSNSDLADSTAKEESQEENP